MHKANLHKRFRNMTLRNKLISYFLPLVAAVILIISLSCYLYFFTTFKSEEINSNMSLVSQTQLNVDYYFSDIKTLLTYFSGSDTLVNTMRNYGSMSYMQKRQANNTISEMSQNINIFKNYISDIMFFGRDGYQYNLANSYRLGEQKVMKQEWFQSYLHQNKNGFYFAPIHRNDYYGLVELSENVVSIILPVKSSGTNVTVGYIVGDMKLSTLSDLVKPGSNITMFDQNGLIMYDTDKGRIQTHVDHTTLASVGGSESGYLTYSLGGEKHLGVYHKLNCVDWSLMISTPYKTFFKPINDATRFIFFIILPISLFAAVVMTVFLSDQIKRPLGKLVDRIETMDIEEYRYVSSDYGIREITDLGHRFEKMMSQIAQLISEVYVFKALQNEAEFQSLKNQITPHFLYNSLQLIKSDAISSHNATISRTVTSLGNLLHYALEEGEAPVTVRDEISYTGDYLEIYRRRFADKFDYRIDVPERIKDDVLLKFIIQPLAENCIKHGLAHVKTGGLIEISAIARDGSLYFTVRDNGAGIPPDRLSSLLTDLRGEKTSGKGIGLQNVHRRIQIKDGEGFGIVSIKSEPGSFTKVTLRIKEIRTENGKNENG